MPHGKPAGMRCVQLGQDDRCQLFGLPQRPAVCLRLRPEPVMCGANFEQANRYLLRLEIDTKP
jgi:hypothetical protein